MPNLYDLHTINENFAFAVGSFIYAVLLTCIFTTKTEKLSQYFRILIHVVLINFFLLIMSFLTKPIKIIDHGYEFLVMNGVLHNLPQPWRFIAFDTWIFAIGLVVTNTPLGFIYQYFVIVLNKKFTLKYQICYFFGASSVAVFYSALYYYMFYYQNYMYFGVGNFLLGSISDENGVVWIAGMSRPYYKQTAVYVNIGMILFVIPVTYIVAVYCSFQTYWFIRNQKKPGKMNSVGRQLSRAAIYTTIVTFISTALPCLFVPYALINTSITMMPYSIFITIALAWAAPCNALVFLYLIKPYRDKIQNVLHLILKCKKKNFFKPYTVQPTNTGY